MKIKIIDNTKGELTVNITGCIQLQIEVGYDEAFIDLDPLETKKLVETLKDNIPELYDTGIDLIAKERKEQIEKHGYSIEDDVDENNSCELGIAARAIMKLSPIFTDFPKFWRSSGVHIMIAKPYKERLIIAGALISAEIDRLNNIN